MNKSYLSYWGDALFKLDNSLKILSHWDYWEKHFCHQSALPLMVGYIKQQQIVLSGAAMLLKVCSALQIKIPLLLAEECWIFL